MFRRGSKGEEVVRIQARLKELGHYQGPVDGDFGGGTEIAVKAFQRTGHLGADGIAGPRTLNSLFPDEKSATPAILTKPLAYRSLALTGAFETNAPVPECFSGLSGDFDGQGISFGALQWNLGQGSLQPLLEEINRSHPDILKEIFDENYTGLMGVLAQSKEEQLRWARAIQNRRYRLHEPWRGCFRTLGRQEAFQRIEVRAAGRLYQAARALCGVYEVRSERAVALMFDIKVQNGSIDETVRTQILRDFSRIDETRGWREKEVARLRIIANRRAEASNPRWVEDVRRRKLTIANGEGTVHGSHYDLKQYGIGLRPAGIL